MRFRETFDAAGPTHRLNARPSSDVDDRSADGLIGVENRVVDVAMEYGTAVHLDVDPGHGQFELLQRELTQVPDRDRVFVESDHEYRANLPADRSLVDALLDVPDGDRWAYSDRLFALEAVAVLTEQSWTYRSVPHETHIRELNAAGQDGLLAELEDMLERVPGTDIVALDDAV
ncbi:hypothetical protein [Haloarcula salinisoli]|uniref:Uncharacterized protein n=2 Tax=Haloarcula salinisoli TaxID=2487746 RepID=A0A8J8C9U3_9EURY|nr:hypothetical protein [Halomicroarcula salinisoli]MBX0304559.1 hypothetical protein [Halomicroarcula salinisoli]